MIRIVIITTVFLALATQATVFDVSQNEKTEKIALMDDNSGLEVVGDSNMIKKELEKEDTNQDNTALANIGESDLSNEGQSSSDVIIRAKRYYGCGCCGCGTQSSVTYSPCGCGCCG